LYVFYKEWVTDCCQVEFVFSLPSKKLIDGEDLFMGVQYWLIDTGDCSCLFILFLLLDCFLYSRNAHLNLKG